MTGTAVASGLPQKINVVMNSINVKINQKPMEEDNILYEGTTYVSLKTVVEMLGVEVDWDEETKTVVIGSRDNPIPNLPPLLGLGLNEIPLIGEMGSFENPIGIPSTAVLTTASAEEKYHNYSYRVNLPGGGYIEKISFSGTYNTPSVSIYGRDNENKSLSLYVLSNDSSRLYHTWRMATLTDEATEVIKHEGKRFLNAYGYQ